MTILTISQTTDYRNVPLNDVTTIAFANLLSPAAATFNANQFDGNQIEIFAEIRGTPGINSLVIVGNNLNGDDYNLQNWDNVDSLTLQGTSGNDFIGGHIWNEKLNGVVVVTTS